MNYHIVRTNERVSDIAQAYNLSVDEIKDINNHIRSWEKLIPGTKLKLPAIPEQIRVELDDSEPFIEDYYPKIAVEELKAVGIAKSSEETKEVSPKEEETPSVTKTVSPKLKTTTAPKPVNSQQRPPYPYYYYYNPYYPYYAYQNYYYGQRKR